MKVSRQITGISVLVLGLSTLAWGTPIQVAGVQNPSVQSSFMLDFGGGFTETSNISSTNYELSLDNDPSPSGYAQFLTYNQNVDSLNIPDGQGGAISTGAITVSIVPGSSGVGSYDPVTGQFTTSEQYLIHFENDLSGIGIPGNEVTFPSSSIGTLVYETATTGTIHQEWSGVYEPLNLHYVCQVNTVFDVPEPSSLALLGIAGIALIRRRR